jgi:hypothetical protein
LYRPRFVAVSIGCCLLMLLAGCSWRGPVAVRLSRDVDKASLEQLTKQGGDVVLLADSAFWTDRHTTRSIPIARRSKTFIIGPGATQMVGEMLGRIFDEVVTVRNLDLVPDLARFDYVIHLVLDDFDTRTINLPIFSNGRFFVELGADVTRADGAFVGRLKSSGSKSFWFGNLEADNTDGVYSDILERASKTFNAAVQESLFGMMEELEELLGTEPSPGLQTSQVHSQRPAERLTEMETARSGP